MNSFRKLFYVLSAATALLSCSNNSMELSDTGGVAINRANFPDPKFWEVISGPEYDKNQDGYLSDYEISRIRNIHCENLGIYSVKGIEYLHELRGIWCLNNHISDWDLSGNPNVTGIWCSHNDFTSLDFSKNPKLEWVYCFNCNLSSLNIANNPELAYIECNANPNLTSLDISHNHKLENLFCSNCGLTSLDLSNNPLLCELDAFSNDLSYLNFSNNENLKRLDIWNNPKLCDVDISNLSGLQFYNCAKNSVTRVDMSKNPELVMLICSYNSTLESLDISGNPKLAYLDLQCDYNLTSLDISHNHKLYHLYAFGLDDIPIDISNNDRLIKTKVSGVYKDEPQNGAVHSYTLDYGGSGEYFENLRHELVLDDGVIPVTAPGTFGDEKDCYYTIDDYHSTTDVFATRGQAIQKLYELAGSPSVSGSSRFTDASSYADAVKWGEDNKICFGYPNICDDTFCPDEPINREDFALMAHRFAGKLGFGTAFDYGRTDWYDDYYDIDFYGWGAFTWAMQFEVLLPTGNKCYPHGRMTVEEINYSADKVFHLDEAASYSSRVNGNGV